MKNNSLIRPGMRAAVLGLGISGRAAARYLQACGAEVRVSDSRREEVFLGQEEPFLRQTGIAWEAGGHSADFFSDVEMVFVSPGVPLDLPLLDQLRGRDVAVLGELAVAAAVLDEPVVAVTGTNGKTTVTTLIGQLLQSGGREVFVGGNIGTPLLEHFLNGGKADRLVLEVSSFQLDTAGSFRPDIALLLNITPDHIDRHGSFEGYCRAKMRIFAHQGAHDFAILNGDDPLCRSLLPHIAGRVLLFGHTPDCAARIDGETVVLHWVGDETYDLSGCPLANAIGLMNAASAILAARAAGCGMEEVLAGIRAFQPLHHRMELVGEVRGVRYYDDSKATNTGAVLAALSQVEGRAVLIAGGRDKGDDYGLLRQSVEKKARHVVLIGEAAPLIETALAGAVTIEHAGTMQEAVVKASMAALAGDAVLLSPACASFDMFTSYAHRGEVFAAAVATLADAATDAPAGGTL